MDRGFNFQDFLLHLTGLGVASYGLKISDERIRSTTIYPSILIHLGSLIVSSPSSNRSLRKHFEKSTEGFVCFYMTIIMFLMQPDFDTAMILYSIAAVVYAFLVMRTTLFLGASEERSSTRWKQRMFGGGWCNFLQLCQAAYFIFLTQKYFPGNFWMFSLPMMFVANILILPKIRLKYEVPKDALNIIFLVFLNVFAINAFAFET